jgi:hypothetical protein
MIEASERGLDHELTAEFAPPPAELADALTFCDMTTDPYGRQISVERRLDEILARYGSDHIVSRSIRTSAPMLIAATYAVASRVDALSNEAVSQDAVDRAVIDSHRS